jgi:acyl-CoA thioesterase-1
MKSLYFLVALSFSISGFAQTILFLGDSLTEGYQLSKEEAFPSLIETELKKNKPEIKVLNGGVSGATTASGLKRLDWYLKAKPEFMVLALGANDGLRGLKIENTEKNLVLVIEKAQERKITVVLAGMKMPTNYGEPYRSQFENMYPRLAKKFNLKLVPFILEGVGGNPKLNLADGIHPNSEGHKIMAKTILKVLEPLL